MTIESGLGLTISVDDSGGTQRAIGPYVTNLTFDIPSDIDDVTAVTQSAHARIYLLADMVVSLNGKFSDDATVSPHVVLSNYRTLAASQLGRTTTIAHSGQTLAGEILYSGFQYSRDANGALNWTSPGNLGSGASVPAWA